MKLRLPLLLLAAAVLLVTPYASQAAPLGSAAPAFCAAASSAPALPGFSTPAADSVLKTILGPKCGTCSLPPCVGAKVGSICGIGGGGQYEFCADIAICPQDGLTQCQCKTGPPF
jgi:hypothetical protein